MTKPKAAALSTKERKQPREKRIPIMMSESELAAIDSWRYVNRVATRSGAIGRLCQMSLAQAPAEQTANLQFAPKTQSAGSVLIDRSVWDRFEAAMETFMRQAGQ